MATSPVPRSPADPAPEILRLGDPGALIAAVPVLLGFHPRESLVLIATRGGPPGRRLGLTVRVDLPLPEHDGDAARAAVDGVLRDAPSGAVSIVVGDVLAADPPRRPLVDEVARLLAGHGVRVDTQLWTESTATRARWACYHPCRCRGSVPDPTGTALAAAAVAHGRVVHADRADLERLVAPADPGAVRRRESLLVAAVDAELRRGDGSHDEVERGRDVVRAAIADAGAGTLVLDDARVLAVARALAVPAVRDRALVWCAGGSGAAAEQLWTVLVRETPDPEAAEPAALLAVSALLRGDGALANVALDRAERAWPGHRLTGLLRAVAETGIRPSVLRDLLGDAPVSGGRRRRGRRVRPAAGSG